MTKARERFTITVKGVDLEASGFKLAAFRLVKEAAAQAGNRVAEIHLSETEPLQ